MNRNQSTEQQAAATVLMVRPVSFGYNPETATSNSFQRPEALGADVQGAARAEFEALVTALSNAGVEVIVFDDTPDPPKPDSIFPNNWVSFHANGTVVLYPMHAANRRAERRMQILNALQTDHGFGISRILDLTHHERDGRFLESTGSMVLDRVNRIAYACLSPRTDPGLLQEFAREMRHRIVSFHGVDGGGRPIYHTNVVMALGTHFAVVTLDTMRDPAERREVRANLEASAHEVIELTLEQMGCFAGNVLELRGRDGQHFLALSERAYQSLRPEQRARLEHHAGLIHVPIPTIEDASGGSVRCMLAAVHLPRSR